MEIKKTSDYKDIPIEKTLSLLETSVKGLERKKLKSELAFLVIMKSKNN